MCIGKNPLIGGCFQSFTRYGRLLDTGIHYVGSMDEGQLLYTIFKYLGINDKLQLQRLDEEGFDRIYLDGKEYRYAMGYERFVETLAQDFPHERTALRHYVAQLQEIGNTSSVELLRQGVFSNGGYKYFHTRHRHLLKSVPKIPPCAGFWPERYNYTEALATAHPSTVTA